MKRIAVVVLFAVMFCFCMSLTQLYAEEATIQQGSKVAFEYTLTVDNQVIDQSQEGKPFEYVQGEGAIIPGLEKQLQGLKAGDSMTIVVPPEEGYGQINPQAVREVPKTQLAPDVNPAVGVQLRLVDDQGNARVCKITEVKDDSIIVDFNHPLAGKTLSFDVKIVSIQ